jgi:hypothetical protein
MAGFRSKAPQRLSPDAERLVADALALDASGSRIEDVYWEQRLSERLSRLLKNGSQTALDAALDHLFKHNEEASDVLAEQAETLAESAILSSGGIEYDALLIAAPILAHTRYMIPSGTIKPEMAQTLQVHLQAHVMASNARVALAPYLYSIDQLPRTHSDTFALTHKLAAYALSGQPAKVELRDMPETAPILADPRYLVAIVVAQHGQALFRWQEDAKEHHAERSACLEQWREQVTPTISTLMPGCEFDLLLPDAFFLSCRESDKQIRPLTVRAAVNYLQGALDMPANRFGAIIGAFGEEQIEEYRVAFTVRGEKDLIYGIVWPVYGRDGGATDVTAEGEPGSPLEQICDELRACGIEDIFRHGQLFEPEYCEDCGAPLYADRSAEIVHAEMPEDAPTQQPLFH